MLDRRFALAVLMAAQLALGASAAAAQSFPTRPMTLVVPFGVGSGSDLVARILGGPDVGVARPDRG